MNCNGGDKPNCGIIYVYTIQIRIKIYIHMYAKVTIKLSHTNENAFKEIKIKRKQFCGI
jgi:hypothetical protein